MKKILIGLVAVLVIVIGGLMILPSLVPLDRIKDEALVIVKNATGRDLTFKDISFSVFPSLAVTVNEISLSNPAGFSTTPMAQLGQLEASLKLFPLLSGQIEIDSFILHRPNIALEVNNAGKNNWTFAPASSASASVASASASVASAKSDAGRTTSDTADGKEDRFFQDVILKNIRLNDGVISFSDSKGTDAKQTLEKISMNIGMDGMDNPLEMDGSVSWQGREITLSTKLEKPRAPFNQGKTKLKTKLVVNQLLDFTFDGQMDFATSVGRGNLELSTPMVRDILAWVNQETPNLPPHSFGALDVKGQVSASSKEISLNNMDISFDALKGQGDLSIMFAKAVPEINAR